MKWIIFFSAMLMLNPTSSTIYEFKKNSNLTGWKIVDDVVMGGRSAGKFYLDDKGNGVFSGYVSLENNGGFSSVRYQFPTKEIGNLKKIKLTLQGDGKSYQFRLKHKRNSYYSYVYNFNTSKDVQEIEIPLNDMYPSFRGRKLKMENFNHSTVEEIGFLISNKVAEKFELKLNSIELME